MNDRRGPWYLLTGLFLGLLAGVLYAWLVAPVEYTDTPPASLRADFKDQYRTLIALAYAAGGDLNRANARLIYLGDPDPLAALVAQADRQAADPASAADVEALRRLAQALGAELASPTPALSPSPTAGQASPTPTASPSLTPPLPSPTTPLTTTLTPAASSSPPGPSRTSAPTRTPTLTPTPFATFTPLPSRTPTATPGAPFVLDERLFVCDPALNGPLLQIQVYDAANQPVPGVEALIAWDGGQERFYTGLKPELGLGYADYALTPGLIYRLQVGAGGQSLNDLAAAECESPGGQRYWGVWQLTYLQP